MDLMVFQIEDQRIFSFLSLTWAFISEADLGSESLRFLGETRFEVYGAWRLIALRSYLADL